MMRDRLHHGRRDRPQRDRHQRDDTTGLAARNRAAAILSTGKLCAESIASRNTGSASRAFRA
jgi:hypothetical protein